MFSCTNNYLIHKSRTVELKEHVARMMEMKNAYKEFVRKSDGKIPLERWGDTINMGLIEIGYGNVELIGLTVHIVQWRVLLKTEMNLRIA
jgi:hypothetical protein